MDCLIVPLFVCCLVLSLSRCEGVGHEALVRRASPFGQDAKFAHRDGHSVAEITVGGRGREDVHERQSDIAKQEPLSIETVTLRPRLLTDAIGQDQVVQHSQERTTIAKIKWRQHPDKCLTRNQSTGSYSQGLVIWDCSDSSHDTLQKWLIPTDEQGVGKIKWAGDQTADLCITSWNGWSGNGNSIHVNSCHGSGSVAATSWTVFNPSGNEYVTIAYSEVLTKCMDVYQERTDNGTPIEMWDCASGIQWELA